MQTRRAQKPITIRSDRAAKRLATLTQDGRSQASVIEEALERMPPPYMPTFKTAEDAARYARIKALVASIPPGSFLSMAEFDAIEYDEDGLPR